MKMPDRAGLGLLLGLVLIATPLAAKEEAPGSELWLHRALIDTIATQDAPAPFTTDGCSGGMSEVWRVVARLSPGFVEMHRGAPPWEPCCITHDRSYHDAAGARSPSESWQGRLDADDALRACVIAAAPGQVVRLQEAYDLSEERVLAIYRWIGEAMFHAVRLGGAPCTGLPWRWGYGFPPCDLVD